MFESREQQTRKNQAEFTPTRECIDQVFTFRQILEHRHSYHQPTIVVLLDSKAAFEFVDREALWQCLLLNGVPENA